MHEFYWLLCKMWRVGYSVIHESKFKTRHLLGAMGLPLDHGFFNIISGWTMDIMLDNVPFIVSIACADWTPIIVSIMLFKRCHANYIRYPVIDSLLRGSKFEVNYRGPT